MIDRQTELLTRKSRAVIAAIEAGAAIEDQVLVRVTDAADDDDCKVRRLYLDGLLVYSELAGPAAKLERRRL